MFKQRLMRQCEAEEASSLQCSVGYVPRKGKPARRERDCTVDCTDFDACEEQQAKAYWKETKCP